MYMGSSLRTTGKCDIGKWGVICGIRADSRSYAYMSVYGYMTHDVCVLGCNT